MIALKENYKHVSVLVVGGGPAGLSAAIAAKSGNRDIDVAVMEKGDSIGNHNLSGAVIETASLKRLLDEAKPDWNKIKSAENIFAKEVKQDNVCFLFGKKRAINISALIRVGKLLGLPFGEMNNHGNHIVSISELTNFLSEIALSIGVEIYTGFGVKEILHDKTQGNIKGVRLVDRGIDKEGHRLPNYVKGEEITADIIILAEGAEGSVTEDLVIKAGLKRKINQVFSVGVKEIFKVSADKYTQFGENRVLHTMGYPLWSPLVGPAIFGGGFLYSYGNNQIAVGIIAGADWQYHNFNPQKALEDFKQHAFIKQFIEGGELVEAGVKIIPEGGYYAIPRYNERSGNNKASDTIGYKNVMIVGDSAGFVNMHKIKGLHNAIESGALSGQASIRCINMPGKAAEVYTELLEQGSVMDEMKSAKNFRSIIGKYGLTVGLFISFIGRFLPVIGNEKDSKSMTRAKFKYDSNGEFDKPAFVALTGAEHREDQPSHLSIHDTRICSKDCAPGFERPCIGFCPAGVYEEITGETVAANPSNCLHCKTCQIKCPYDNIKWSVPEGGGGPKYKHM
ncbi:MAG: FAD-dependent oxidoreductase [Candidatus Anammoxibacter sp.]